MTVEPGMELSITFGVNIQIVRWTGLDGLDLDVEEALSLAIIFWPVDRPKWGFGHEFLPTLALVATAMRGQPNFSVLDYKALEKAFTTKIAWYNTQSNCGWRYMKSTSDYEWIAARG